LSILKKHTAWLSDSLVIVPNLFFPPQPPVPASDDSATAGRAATTAGGGGGTAREQLNTGRINFSGLGDSDSSDEEDQGQAFYAGGSTSSGNVILGPGKKKKDDIVGNLFRAAREAGAEEVAEPGTSNTTRVRPLSFVNIFSSSVIYKLLLK
jgi:hypothetical protein